MKGFAGCVLAKSNCLHIVQICGRLKRSTRLFLAGTLASVQRLLGLEVFTMRMRDKNLTIRNETVGIVLLLIGFAILVKLSEWLATLPPG